jgi:hypothetical protein
MALDPKEFVLRNGNGDFWAIRGHAIQVYANLEDSLCHLFSVLTGTNQGVASIIFYKVVNAGVRDSIIEKIMKKKHGDSYTTFWNSFLKVIRRVTETRNHIVHWHVVNFVGPPIHDVALVQPPNIWELEFENPSPLTVTNMMDFIEECCFAVQLCNMFRAMLDPVSLERLRLTSEQEQTWHDIFQQPVAYPPLGNHPLCQKPTEHETQLPPSPELPGS